MQDVEGIALDAFQQQPQQPPQQQHQQQQLPQDLVQHQQQHQPQPDQDDINELENLPPLAAAGFALVPSRKASDDADAAAGSPPRQFGADRPV
jgi:hypothetical protein